MSLKNKKSWLAVGVFLFLSGMPAFGQELADLQFFAPAEVRPYGSDQETPEGWFFNWDFLEWSVSSPARVQLGFQNLSRTVWYTASDSEVQTNSHDTGFLTGAFTEGNRVEFGHMSDGWGWMAGGYSLHVQTQRNTLTDVSMAFQDLGTGEAGTHRLQGWVADMIGYTDDAATYTNLALRDLPVTFYHVDVTNRTEVFSTELMAIRRLSPLHNGGLIELFGGVRYMEIRDRLNVEAYGRDTIPGDTTGTQAAVGRFDWDRGSDGDGTNPSPIAVGSVLSDSYWNTDAVNRIVGPQVGGRITKSCGRWTLSSEGRFFAGINSQSLHNQGVLGEYMNSPVPYAFTASTSITREQYPYMPTIRSPMGFSHNDHETEWSPAAELRLNLKYQLTRAIYVNGGWTGTWIGGVARATNLNDYTITGDQVMNINAANNRQNVFMQGASFGVTVNR